MQRNGAQPGMKTLNDQLLAHHINTIKRGAGLGASVNQYLDEMRAIIKRRVLSFDEERRTKARLQELIESLAIQLDKPAGKWLRKLKSDLKDFAKYEAIYQAEVIGGWVGVELTEPTVNQVWAAAKFQPLSVGTSPIDFEKAIDDWGADEVSRLVMGVKSGFVQGQTARQIVKDVVGAGGLSDISQRNALAMAQTTLAHVASEARFATYAENDDVVIGYEWVSTLDSRTSSICRERDGMVYLFTDKDQPKPPAHFNCRSNTSPKLSPEFDFLDEGSTRAAKGADGVETVAADTTYYGFLKNQPASYQDEVLGKTKGQIFRNAGLSPEEFRKITVDNLGRPLTLDEMAAADKRVADYLGKKD